VRRLKIGLRQAQPFRLSTGVTFDLAPNAVRHLVDQRAHPGSIAKLFA